MTNQLLSEMTYTYSCFGIQLSQWKPRISENRSQIADKNGVGQSN